MLTLRKQGMRDSEIQKTLGVNNAGKYLSGRKRSFLCHLRAEHERLGQPRAGFKWLPIRLKPRGTPDKIWIQVPARISNYNDVMSVLEQLTPREESYERMGEFGYKSRDELIRDRANLFGFYAGTVLGDAGKPIKGTKRFLSMTVALTLSKDKSNSHRFGEFASLSTSASIGLSMKRMRDAPVSQDRFTKSECYRWISQASPLIAWTFKACLGLEEGQLTTYDPIRMDWLLTSPRDFKIRFLQGLAESDGWVEPGRDKVVIVSSPNEALLMKLLSSLNIPCKLFNQPPITRLEIETEAGLALPIFSERICSNNYQSLVTMGTAKTFPPRKRLPSWFLEQVQPTLSNGTNYNVICLEIARATEYKISSATAKKYATRETLL